MRKEEFLKRIGENITRLRNKKGLTISYLGDLAGMGKNNLIPIIKGQKNLTVVTLLKIAEALEVEPKDLLK